MYRNARVYVADLLDEIVIEATIFTADWRAEAPALVETVRAQVKSSGEPESREWLKDALVALIEQM
jgi:hypothetical protein